MVCLWMLAKSWLIVFLSIAMLLNNGKFSDATEIAVELSNVSKQVLPGLPTLVRIIVTNPTKEDITILPLDAHDFGRWCWTWENEKGEVLRELKYGDFLLAIPSLPVGTDPKVMLGAGKSREWMILVPVPEEVEQEKQVRLTVELIEDTEFHGKASVKELYTVGKPCQIKGGGKDLHREAQLIIRNGDGYSAKYMMVEGKGAADFRDAAFRGNDYLTLIWFLASFLLQCTF